MIKKLKPSKKSIQRWSYLITAVITLLFILLGLCAWQLGWFTDIESFQEGIKSLGAFGVIIYCLLQIAQVIIPALPSSVIMVAGVALFGPLWSFIWSYLSICLGSFLVFGISKVYGPVVLSALFPKRLIDRYLEWTSNQKTFTHLFALAIFFPVAPDNMLCYLAGTTLMNWKTFITIIVLGKPASIFLYSMGVNGLFNWLVNLFN